MSFGLHPPSFLRAWKTAYHDHGFKLARTRGRRLCSCSPSAAPCRAELTELERGEHLAARKQIYEQLNPETKAGAVQGLGMQRAATGDLAAESAARSFATYTAAKTGLSERTIRQSSHEPSTLIRRLRTRSITRQSLTNASSSMRL
jgi:hypothetical protein